MIKLFRVDHRLLHGQVAVSCFNYVGADSIFICNDILSKDDLAKTAMRCAKPANCKLVIKNISESIHIINSGKLDKYKVLIVVYDIKDAYEVITKSLLSSIRLNLGGTTYAQNKKKIISNVYISDEEEKLLIDLRNRNIEIYAQQIPGGESKILGEEL